jgi:hypothetical protein
MPQFYKANIEDFDNLLNLVMEFELDKETLYESEDKINKAKMLKENKKHLKKFL